MNAPIVILCATKTEARLISSELSSGLITTLPDNLVILITGMGFTNKAVLKKLIDDIKPAGLVSWGFSGGLLPGLPSGTVCVPAVVSSGEKNFKTDESWRTSLCNMLTASSAIASKIAHTDEILSTPKSKRQLHFDSGAEACDMESFIVGQFAKTYQLPWVAVRAVIDEATQSLPAWFNLVVDDQGQVLVLKLLNALLKNPLDIKKFLHMVCAYGRAKKSLKRIDVKNLSHSCPSKH